MANWSDCEIKLVGSEENISVLTKELEECIEEEWCTFITSDKFKETNTRGSDGGIINDIQFYKNSISIFMSGRYCGVFEWFKTIVQDKKLTGSYCDMEGGCNFFNLIEAKNGEIVNKVDVDYLSVESVNHCGLEFFIENYRENFASLEDAEYAIAILVECGADREKLIKEFGLQ